MSNYSYKNNIRESTFRFQNSRYNKIIIIEDIKNLFYSQEIRKFSFELKKKNKRNEKAIFTRQCDGRPCVSFLIAR